MLCYDMLWYIKPCLTEAGFTGGVAGFAGLVVRVLVVVQGTGVQTLALPPQVHLALSAAQAAVRPRFQTLCAVRVAGLARPRGHVTIVTGRGWGERIVERACA